MAPQAAERETRDVVALLGGRKVFARRIDTPQELRRALREGFPYASFEAVLDALQTQSKELASLLGVATRTLARRKDKQLLSPIESDRLYRIARVLHRARTVLGSLDRARAWLYADNRALGGETPIGVLDTEIGERQVEELLDRIDYGIPS